MLHYMCRPRCAMVVSAGRRIGEVVCGCSENNECLSMFVHVQWEWCNIDLGLRTCDVVQIVSE